MRKRQARGHEECDSQSNKTLSETPGDDIDANKDPTDKGKGPKEPPVKMVKVDELEVSIEKILERTLRKAAQECSPSAENTLKDSARGEESPRR